MPPRVPTVPSSGPGPTPRTPLGLSGLGAVGGPRGVGAGGLRVILEFLTQYDDKAVKKLEADIAKIQKQEARTQGSLDRQNQIIRNAAGIRTRVEGLRAKFVASELRDIKKVSDLLRSTTRSERAAGRAQLQGIQQIAAARGVSKRDLTFLMNADRNLAAAAQRTVAARRQEQTIQRRLVGLGRQRLSTEAALLDQVRLRALLAPRLGALVAGALGGLVGGAAVGVAFTAIQALLDSIGESLQDIVDPANDAREALEEVGKAVSTLASEENISNLEAARRIVAEFAGSGRELSAEAIAQAVALQSVSEKQDQLNKLQEVSTHISDLRNERIRAEVVALFGQRTALADVMGIFVDVGRATQQNAQDSELYATAVGNVTRLMDAETQAAEENARAKSRMAEATAYAAIQERNLGSAIDAAADMSQRGIQDQLDALSQSRANSARDQEAALLQFQLGLEGGAAVDPNSVSGQFKIAALDAKIAQLRAAGGGQADTSAVDAIEERIKSLQKLSDEQSRFNKLLDLQFRKSQVIRRQEGETIADFLQRRAQEQRHILEEEGELQREAQIAVLEAERDKLQAQLDRFEGGNEAAIEALEKEKRIEALRLRLAEINEDKITEARRQALEDQAEKNREFWEKVKTYGNLARIQEITAAVRFAQTMSQLLSISGEVSGAKFAANQLRTLLQSGLIPPAQIPAVLQVLRAVEALAAQYNNQLGNILGQHIGEQGRGGIQEFQHGGVFTINNAQNPFGQNTRAGEAGTELGVILSNKVTRALQESQRGPMVGSITVQGTGDPRRDKYELRRIIREEIVREMG